MKPFPKSQWLFFFSFLLGIPHLSGAVRADDWPQWQGPDRTNVSKETGLLKKWPKEGPKLVWTFEKAGEGYSAPAIVGDRLYTMGARGKSEFVIVLDASTGKEVRSTEIGPKFTFKANSWGDGPRSTPTVDGDKIYALGAQGELVSLETATGKIIWHHNLYNDFSGEVQDISGTPKIGWGYCEGPLVDGDKVVCTPGGDKGLLLALNKQTGEQVWRSADVKSKAPYSSIIVAEVGGIRQYIQMSEQGVVGVAAKDGRLLWRYEKEYSEMLIPTPIFHDSRVFVIAGWNQGADLIRLQAAEKGIEAKKVYSQKLNNEEGGVVLVGKHLYGYFDNRGWACLDFQTGEIAKAGDKEWLEKRKLNKGSLTYADGQLYCFSDDDGTAVLVEANPAVKWQENGRFTIPKESKLHKPNGRIWTHPVVANGRLYLRDQDLIFCYDIK
jgi:outer membrane protein assembly factor BamB